MHMERAGVNRLADLHLFNPGVIAGPVEPDLKAAGMMLADQGATHTVCESTPFTLRVHQATCTQP